MQAGRFHFSGLPLEGEVIMGCRNARWLTQTADHWAGDQQTCRVMSQDGVSFEHLNLWAEPYGVLCWKSDHYGAEFRAQILDGVFTPISYEGSHNSLLHLFWSVGRIPLCPYADMTWQETADVKPPMLAPFTGSTSETIQGRCTHFDAKSELFQVAFTLNSKITSRNFSLEFTFGEGLSLITIRQETATSWLRSHGVTPEKSTLRHTFGNAVAI